MSIDLFPVNIDISKINDQGNEILSITYMPLDGHACMRPSALETDIPIQECPRLHKITQTINELYSAAFKAMGFDVSVTQRYAYMLAKPSSNEMTLVCMHQIDQEIDDSAINDARLMVDYYFCRLDADPGVCDPPEFLPERFSELDNINTLIESVLKKIIKGSRKKYIISMAI